MTITYPLLS